MCSYSGCTLLISSPVIEGTLTQNLVPAGAFGSPETPSPAGDRDWYEQATAPRLYQTSETKSPHPAPLLFMQSGLALHIHVPPGCPLSSRNCFFPQHKWEWAAPAVWDLRGQQCCLSPRALMCPIPPDAQSHVTTRSNRLCRACN